MHIKYIVFGRWKGFHLLLGLVSRLNKSSRLSSMLPGGVDSMQCESSPGDEFYSAATVQFNHKICRS